MKLRVQVILCSYYMQALPIAACGTINSLSSVGALDLPEKLELTEQLAKSIPGARSAIIAGAAHMVSMEQPQAFKRIVLDFLGEL